VTCILDDVTPNAYRHDWK